MRRLGGLIALLALFATQGEPAGAAVPVSVVTRDAPRLRIAIDDQRAKAKALAAEAENLAAKPETREQAVALLREAISLDPGEPGHHLALGGLLNEMNRPEEAIESLQDAIAVAPRFGAAYLEWGKALMALGRFDEAVTRFEAAAPVMGNDSELYARWCAALESLKRRSDAAAVCARVEE